MNAPYSVASALENDTIPLLLTLAADKLPEALIVEEALCVISCVG